MLTGGRGRVLNCEKVLKNQSVAGVHLTKMSRGVDGSMVAGP